MKHKIQLNDGPLNGILMTTGANFCQRVRSISAEYIDPDNDDPTGTFSLLSAKYDYGDSDELKPSGDCVHKFFHDKTLPVLSPVNTGLWSRFQGSMTSGDRERWNGWRWKMFEAAEDCRDISRQFGSDEAKESIDEFQTLVLNIPFMEPVDVC